MYNRVIPRDLFNESSLLKCMGRVYINLETADAPDVSLLHEGEAFNIDQNPASGSLCVLNVQLMVRGNTYLLERPLNSRREWPLYLTTLDDELLEVFTDSGEFTPEFLEFLQWPNSFTLKPEAS